MPTQNENHSWTKFANSESCRVGGSEESLKLAMKAPNSSSVSPADTETAVEQVGKKRRRRKVSEDGKTVARGGGESEHEMHIWTERERRKKMTDMFSSLHALLPQLPAKADKSTIIDEAVSYITTLEHTLQTLQKQRLEKLKGTVTLTPIDCEPSNTLTSSQIQAMESREAFLAHHHQYYQGQMRLSASVPLPPAGFQTWFSPNVVLSMFGDTAHISVCSPRRPGLLTTIYYILEKHNLDVVSAHISSDQYRSMFMIHAHASRTLDRFAEAFSVEEIFKLAVGEMNLWLLSC